MDMPATDLPVSSEQPGREYLLRIEMLRRSA